jgi:hypothetical protein
MELGIRPLLPEHVLHDHLLILVHVEVEILLELLNGALSEK